MKLFVFILLFILFFSKINAQEEVIGIWRKGDWVYEIDVHYFIVYQLGGDVTVEPKVGTYMIGNGSLLVRYVDVSVFPDFFLYNLTDGQLSLENQFSYETIVLSKVDEMLINGFWEMKIQRRDLLVLSSTYNGDSWVQNGLFQGILDNYQYVVGFLDNWACDSASGSVSVKRITDMTSQAKLFTSLFTSSSVDCTSDYSGFELSVSGLTKSQDVFFSNEHSSTIYDGSYHFREENCNHWLKLNSGFFREVITGNRLNCTTESTFKIGTYGISSSAISLKYFSPIGNKEETLSFTVSHNNSLLIGDQEYKNTTQVIRVFNLQKFLLNTTTITSTAGGGLLESILGLLGNVVGLLVDVLVGLLQVVLTIIAGPSGVVDIDKFDIIGLVDLSVKRDEETTTQEAYIVFHDSPENKDNVESINADNELILEPEPESSTSSSSSSSSSSIISSSTSSSTSLTDETITDQSSNSESEDSSSMSSSSVSSSSSSSSYPPGTSSSSGGQSSSSSSSGGQSSSSSSSSRSTKSDVSSSSSYIVVESQENNDVLSVQISTETDEDENGRMWIIIGASLGVVAVGLTIFVIVVYKYFTNLNRF
eukprot:TRINITY_DN455_c0_g1_i1.p1 TRINITY_DN455_c0_g1~~TRINITY_DN455_c0_g1_i1.p1  ORF type:complete len:592 (+),score=123.50 TRINITY_DN455_c0_g1_i1:106-1881(+)